MTPTPAEVEAFRIAFETEQWDDAEPYGPDTAGARRVRAAILAGYAAVDKLRAEKVEPPPILAPWAKEAEVVIRYGSQSGWYADCESKRREYWKCLHANDGKGWHDFQTCDRAHRIHNPDPNAVVRRVNELGPQPWMKRAEKPNPPNAWTEMSSINPDAPLDTLPTYPEIEGTHASAEYAALSGQIAALRANVEMLLKRAVLKPAKKGAKKR